MKFCRTADNVRIAYACVGDGPPLVWAAHWLSHLARSWESPIWRHWTEEFATDHSFVHYDERGNGLSDWDNAEFSIDAFVHDLEAVVDTLGFDRFALIGSSKGGATAMAYAARHPGASLTSSSTARSRRAGGCGAGPPRSNSGKRS